MRTLERVFAVLEGLFPALIVYFQDARAIGTCTDPSCSHVRPGISHLQVDPAGTATDVGLALLLGLCAGILIWVHASSTQFRHLALMAILIAVCGMSFVLFAFSALSWTAGTVAALMIPAVFVGIRNQFL